MSAEAVRDGLITRLRTVSGLRVLAAEPTSIQAAPLAYVAFISGTLDQRGQIKVRTWRFAVRVCVPFHDNVMAEDQLVPYADTITDAILADLTLGGTANVVPTIDISAEGTDGYIEVGNPAVVLRSIVFRMDVRDKT